MKVSNDVDLKQIAEDTELFTGAELEGLCREAGIVALREDISASVVWVSLEECKGFGCASIQKDWKSVGF
ncbi:hypothetical protein CsSME_00017168 [Camellia sinensis var. sinensis]